MSMFPSWTVFPTILTKIPPCPSTRPRWGMTMLLALWLMTHLLLQPLGHPDGGRKVAHLAGDLHPRNAPAGEHRDVGVVVRLLDGAAAAGTRHAGGRTPRATPRPGHGPAAH